MRISDWSSDVCSSDLGRTGRGHPQAPFRAIPKSDRAAEIFRVVSLIRAAAPARSPTPPPKSLSCMGGWGGGTGRCDTLTKRHAVFVEARARRPGDHRRGAAGPEDRKSVWAGKGVAVT